ncbi:hypothetical protein QO002_002375 [Pararhizobium capsulatum DSM 1112]|uniref:Uncharacterized protein n=1 Tax=Pararhizobium capsulatum DSM 1112 TaxID=1121113 RepID=A0ABU0BQK7_9HYPH|nr:hypothetical protein [Pararhizobium capsulatum]MDQ0320237.1 hypothetical protein [Pararhizobium capsulatum DSM 1112]
MKIFGFRFGKLFWCGAVVVSVAYGLAIHHLLTAGGIYGRETGYPLSFSFIAVMAALSSAGAWVSASGVRRSRVYAVGPTTQN